MSAVLKPTPPNMRALSQLCQICAPRASSSMYFAARTRSPRQSLASQISLDDSRSSMARKTNLDPAAERTLVAEIWTAPPGSQCCLVLDQVFQSRVFGYLGTQILNLSNKSSLTFAATIFPTLSSLLQRLPKIIHSMIFSRSHNDSPSCWISRRLFIMVGSLNFAIISPR